MPLLGRLWVTSQLTFGAALVAVPIAMAAGLARRAPWRWLRMPATAYVEVYRGTSALVQLFWFYFVLPFFGVHLGAVTADILVVGLITGAYRAEVVRGAALIWRSRLHRPFPSSGAAARASRPCSGC